MDRLIKTTVTDKSHFQGVSRQLSSASTHRVCRPEELLCVSSQTGRGYQGFLLAFGELAQNKVKVCRCGHSIEDVCFVWYEQL